MKEEGNRKRSARTAGIKALIATASVAATIAGWALLPANDPQAAAGSATQNAQQPPSISVPDNSQSLPDNTQLPQVQVPQTVLRSPFTRTHSSR